MAAALEQILGIQPLTESMRTVADGVPNPYPGDLYTVKPANRVIGNQAKYIRIRGERRTAKSVYYGAKAHQRQLLEVGSSDMKMIHFYESFHVNAAMLSKLMSFDQYVQDEGVAWLGVQLKSLATRFQNSRIIATGSVLRNGAIYLDSEGNLLPTSSGASETYSFQVPATHQTQINSIIDASWAAANTDIPQHITNIKQYSREETGMELDTVLYGKNIPLYLANNNLVQAYLARNAGRNEAYVDSGEIQGRLFGLNWKPAYQSFSEDDDQTLTNAWADDLCVFLPSMGQEQNMNWWGMFEGSYMVPKTLNIVPGDNPLSNMETIYGMGSYAVPCTNPTGFEVFGFDTFLPGLKNEKAIFQADVTP